MNAEKIRETFKRLVNEGSDGFTLTSDGEEFKPDKGYAVARRTHDNLDDAITDLQSVEFIGWWIDPKTHKTYIEVVRIFESNLAACLFGLAFNQIAIYDFAKDTTIDLSGLYDNGT